MDKEDLVLVSPFHNDACSLLFVNQIANQLLDNNLNSQTGGQASGSTYFLPCDAQITSGAMIVVGAACFTVRKHPSLVSVVVCAKLFEPICSTSLIMVA